MLFKRFRAVPGLNALAFSEKTGGKGWAKLALP